MVGYESHATDPESVVVSPEPRKRIVGERTLSLKNLQLGANLGSMMGKVWSGWRLLCGVLMN